MLPTALLKPAAVYIAIAILCTIFFFPQSLSHVLISGLVHKTLKPIQEALILEDEVLSTTPTNREAWSAVYTKIHGVNAIYLEALFGLEGQAKLLQLEISHGRISAGQLGEVINRTRDLASKAFGLGTLAVSEVMAEADQQALVEDRNQYLESSPIPHQTSRVTRQTEYMEKSEKMGSRSLDDLIPLLKLSTAELRFAAQDALQTAIDWLDMINNTRWKKTPADALPVEAREAKLQRLRDALRDFRSDGTKQILEPFRDMFDMTTGQLKDEYKAHLTGSSRGLFRCFTFTSTLVGFCTALISLLELLVDIDVGTPKNKFQFPGKFVQSVVQTVSDDSSVDNNNLDIRDHLVDHGDTVEKGDRIDYDPDSKTGSKKQRKYPRDPDARDPSERSLDMC